MSKKPKYLQLEEQVLDLKLQQWNILVIEQKKLITRIKNHLKIMELSGKQFPGLKKRNEELALQSRSALERAELTMERLISQRDGTELQIQWLKKPKKRR